MPHLRCPTRRNLLKSTAITTASIPAVQWNSLPEKPEEDDVTIPNTDPIDDYLGVTALSYDDPNGELWYRTTSDHRDDQKDCVYRIVQTVAIQDDDDASDNNDGQKIIVDGQFELQLAAVDSQRLPTFYREFESELNTIIDADTDAVSTSHFSIKSYPGILTHYDKSSIEESPDNLNTLWYMQSFPWGLLYWDIVYDSAASVALNVDRHQEWIQNRKHRDWDIPSLATKPHWEELHHGEQSAKGRYRGDISQIFLAAPSYGQEELEQTDQQLWETAETEQPTPITVSTYR